jgi:single-strand DNA-binding protein
MNKLTIIGNLTRDPESRTVGDADTVCTFTVAVNRRAHKDHPEADYFRVSAWNRLGEIARQYLTKGKKVAVTGPVAVSSYEAKDGGGTRFQLEVRADDLELLSPRERGDADDSGC